MSLRFVQQDQKSEHIKNDRLPLGSTPLGAFDEACATATSCQPAGIDKSQRAQSTPLAWLVRFTAIQITPCSSAGFAYNV